MIIRGLCLVVLWCVNMNGLAPVEQANPAQELVNLAYAFQPHQLTKLSIKKRHQIRVLQKEIRNIRNGHLTSANSISDLTLREAVKIIQAREEHNMGPIRQSTVNYSAPGQQVEYPRKERLP